MPAKFYCTSSIDWNVCQWLRHGNEKPCQTFANPGAKSCDNAWRSWNNLVYEDGREASGSGEVDDR